MSIDEKINLIDSKLDILFNKLDYKDYLNFIKDDKYLSTYDTLVAYTDLKLLPKEMNNFLSDDMFNKIIKIIDDKISSLN
jgi:hypothetical protein